MIGGEIGRPASNSTGPGTPMPIPHRRPGRASVVRSSEATRASTRSRQRSGPASILAGSSWWPRMRPSSVVTATSMLVAPRSATRTYPPSDWKVSWRGGRPPVLGPTSPSLTSPRSMSSPTRCATIARPRPVRATSSARELDRPRRISSSTVTRASIASSGTGPWRPCGVVPAEPDAGSDPPGERCDVGRSTRR